VSIKVTVKVGDLQARAEQAAEQAMKRVAGELFAAFQQSFTAKAWDWPRDLPTRKLGTKGGANLKERIASYNDGDGVRAGSPRNLIDFGNLRQSGSWEMTGPTTARFTWSAAYATAVHEGAWIWAWGRRPPYIGARSVHLPPRPWTRAVLGQEQVSAIKPFPLDERLKDVWLKAFRR